MESDNNIADLTIAEAAGRLKVSARTVSRYINQGLLPATRITRKTVRIKEADVLMLLRGRKCQNN